MFNVFLNHWFVLRCSDELWIFFRSNQTHFLDMFDVLFWKAYIANDDSEVEGVWEDWYTDQVYSVRVTIVWYCAILHQPVEYLPWAPDRPYDGGTKYNCMLLKVNFRSVFFFTDVSGDSKGLWYNAGNNDKSKYRRREMWSRTLQHLWGCCACQESHNQRTLPALHL